MLVCVTALSACCLCRPGHQVGYEHFMQKEIHEQPEALTQTMRGRCLIITSSAAGE